MDTNPRVEAGIKISFRLGGCENRQTAYRVKKKKRRAIGGRPFSLGPGGEQRGGARKRASIVKTSIIQNKTRPSFCHNRTGGIEYINVDLGRTVSGFPWTCRGGTQKEDHRHLGVNNINIKGVSRCSVLSYRAFFVPWYFSILSPVAVD
jgi:hypothetical protein